MTGEQVCPPITGQNGQPIPLHGQRKKVDYIISSSLACVKGISLRPGLSAGREII
ncbi:MAG: hypothetical protein HPY66_2698 [Firmicutes bacterium]|nr:hypothetical protein [Bacillota bacterium]